MEIWQNCVIFNHDCFKGWTEKAVRDEMTINLVAGEPMIYGKDKDKGLKAEGCHITICSADEASIWDPSTDSMGPGFLMTQMDKDPSLPRPMGVLRQVEAPTLDELVNDQIKEVTDRKGEGNLKDIIYTPDVWTIE